jgi:hypothetical protein
VIGQEGHGVRFGAGSIYDWVVEEIFAAGSEDSQGMGDDKDKDNDIAAALRMLAAFRRKRTFRLMVERAFDEAEQQMKEGHSPPRVDALPEVPPPKAARPRPRRPRTK